MQVSKQTSTGFRRYAWHFFHYKGLWLFATMKTKIFVPYYWRRSKKSDVQYVRVLHVNMSERCVKISHASCNWTLFATLFQTIVWTGKTFQSASKRQWKIERLSSWSIRKQKMSTRMWSCCLSSVFVLHIWKLRKRDRARNFESNYETSRLFHLKLPKWLNCSNYTKMARYTIVQIWRKMNHRFCYVKDVFAL